MRSRGRILVAVIALALLAGSPAGRPAAGGDSPSALQPPRASAPREVADLEFRVHPAMTARERGLLAVELYRLRVIDTVRHDEGLYAVHLRQPGNLMALESVRGVLGRHGVTNVDSLVDIVVRSMTS